MTQITSRLEIPDDELAFTFVRASGPGGQKVNKVSTAVELRFDLGRSPSLSAAVRARLRGLAGNRVTTDGILVMDAQRHRTQARNREDVLERFVALVRQALVPPRPRTATRPTAGSRRRRLEAKRHASQTKRLRGDQGDGQD